MYAGLYEYQIHSKEWKLLREDGSKLEERRIRSRMAHAMVYHTVSEVVYKV